VGEKEEEEEEEEEVKANSLEANANSLRTMKNKRWTKRKIEFLKESLR
jgi:hypothetical protein